MKHSEDKDPAWDLLKHAQKPEPAGNFTQNVMREVRQLDSAPGRAQPRWFSLRLAGALAAAAAVAIGGFMVLNTSEPSGPAVANTEAIAPVVIEDQITIEEFTDELEELAYLSDLMDVSDTSLLADEDLAALLF